LAIRRAIANVKPWRAGYAELPEEDLPVCSRFQTILFVVILLRALGYAESEAPARSQIHESLATAHANGEFSGIVAVRQHGATVFQESLGYANYEKNLAITSDAWFEIASVTKTFTASGILLLRDRGRLTIDDPLSRYLPDFPNGDHITIKNLLSHTSGLGESLSTAITEDESLPDVVAAIGKRPALFCARIEQSVQQLRLSIPCCNHRESRR
jgi:CubicO group peptidase (beta-lactamase class C family)